MAKPDGRVERGQSLRKAISATRWNDLCDAADLVHGRRGGVTAGEAAGGHRPYSYVIARNNTGSVVDHFEARLLKVFSAPSEFGDIYYSLESGGVLTGTETRNFRFGVALEPIQAGKYGKVAFEGIVRCKVTQPANSGAYVVFDKNNDPPATVNPTGHAALLQEPANGDNIALILLGAGNYLAYGKLEDAWPINTTKVVQQWTGVAVDGAELEASNFYADLPAGEKRLLFSGKPQFLGAPLASPEWTLIAAQCDSDPGVS